MEKKDKKSLTDYFGIVALKLGGQIHLRTLRDAFASIMPFMILAGFITFINYTFTTKTSIIVYTFTESGTSNS